MGGSGGFTEMISVDCIRVGAVRLCLGLILGLLVVPGYVVAPVLFANAGSSSLAGSLAGDVFHMANTSILFLIAAVLVFWFRMKKSGAEIGKVRWLSLIIVALMVVGNEFGVAPVIADLKAQAGPIDGLDKDDPQRTLFGLWHGVSAVFHLIASLAAALLLALGAMRPSLPPKS